MNSQPPRINIHSRAGTDAGSHPVPDPACGEGNCGSAPCSSIFILPMFIPLIELSCPEAWPNMAMTARQSTSEYNTTLDTITSPSPVRLLGNGAHLHACLQS